MSTFKFSRVLGLPLLEPIARVFMFAALMVGARTSRACMLELVRTWQAGEAKTAIASGAV